MSITSERLKALRIEKNKTQNDIATLLGMERTSYVKYENGKNTPPSDRLSALAEYYNVTTDYLLGRTPELKKGLLGDLGKGHSPQTVTMDWLIQLCLKTGNLKALDALSRISITETGDVKLVGVDDKTLERTLKLQVQSLISVLEIASDNAVITEGLAKAKWHPNK